MYLQGIFEGGRQDVIICKPNLGFVTNHSRLDPQAYGKSSNSSDQANCTLPADNCKRGVKAAPRLELVFLESKEQCRRGESPTGERG
ncbi:hypothetical protein Y032_0019g3798 [Ancylostoma ceylanicum]|uniref:Uncharacterized protein n=1 Tax=Ancylostoma ceylanicum TaxID=53326 RepID=A0A016V3T6_9BILA|nr:hypothetical protein Y032_0019g3798 [Ancylostoma ceylanicum]